MINVKSIISASLRSMGADGLVSDDGYCKCWINDLAPCGKSISEIDDCTPAVERLCPKCGSGVFVKFEEVNRGGARWRES